MHGGQYDAYNWLTKQWTNRQAEKLDPSVYTTMREVPIEYQKEKQAEYRVMELQPDDISIDMAQFKLSVR